MGSGEALATVELLTFASGQLKSGLGCYSLAVVPTPVFPSPPFSFYLFMDVYLQECVDAHRKQKGLSGPLELELQAFVSCPVFRFGIQTLVL